MAISTVRLLTHVLCKQTHFFFQLIIATKPNSIQTSFNREINTTYGVPPQGHLQGQTRDTKKHTFFSRVNGKYRHVL